MTEEMICWIVLGGLMIVLSSLIVGNALLNMSPRDD